MTEHDATDIDIDIGPSIGDDVDIASPEIYERAGIPHAAFARLRHEAPVYWHPWTNERGGFWAITRHADVYRVSRDATTFCSREHVNLWDLDAAAKEARRSIIETDAPAHSRLRRLVLPPFTRHRVGNYAAATRAIACELLDSIVDAGPVDLVDALAAPLPIRVIVSILGVPADDADFMVELSNHLVEGTSGQALDPTAYGNTTPLELLPFNSPAAHALFEYGRALGEQRRRCPADDVVTTLVQNADDTPGGQAGDQLTDAEFCNFFQLLVFAGNETTRTAISHGLLAFMHAPEQLKRLRDDPALLPNAVEEVIRIATPVLHMRRTATRDVELHATSMRAGDWVVLWYAASNFDERVFDDPLGFDVARPIQPNHQAFGGFGPHHCLGAHLARLEIGILLEELARRGARIEATGPPRRVQSNFVHGIKQLPGAITTR
jgi:cytochrome P450